MIGELTLDDDAVATMSDEGEWGSDTPELLHVLDQSFHPVRDAEMADHHRPFGVAALDRASAALGLEVRLAQPVGPDPMDDAAVERDGGGGTTNALPSQKASAAALYELSDEYTRAEARDVARAVLAGYANDKSAEQVSRVLQKQLGLPAAQADVLATTELTRVAAADALSDAGKAAEAEGRKGQVRFISKDRSCPLCQALHGRVYTLAKAQDVIPVHPHCTCRWQPVAGPARNVFCPTGEGGGIDPTCSPATPGTGGVKTTDDLRGELTIDPVTGRMGTKDLINIKVKAYRVGTTTDKYGRGVYLSGDREGAEKYASLHPGEEVKEYAVSLDKVLLAGHQNDVTRKLFNKSYMEFYKGGVDAGRKADVKVAKKLKQLGYDGLILLKPAPPATSEVAVFTPGSLKEND